MMVFLFFGVDKEQVKLHANWCELYDYNPTQVHLNMHKNAHWLDLMNAFYCQILRGHF
jgi:hypothetical protein